MMPFTGRNKFRAGAGKKKEALINGKNNLLPDWQKKYIEKKVAE